MVRLPRAASLLILSLVVPPVTAVAQSFQDGYRVDRFTTDDGLPAHTIHDLLQMPDGVLWIATNGGLAHYDGRRFETITPGDLTLAIGRVGGVAAGRGDTVWFTPEPGGIAYVSGGRAWRLLAGDPAYDLEQDADGTLWVMAATLARVANGRLHPVNDVVAGYSLSFSRPNLWKDETGAIVFRLSGADSLYRVSQGVVTTVPRDDSDVLLVNTVTRRRITTRAQGATLVVAIPDGRPVTLPRTAGSAPRLVDRTGRVWVTTRTHLEVYGPESRLPITRFALRDAGGVVTMIEDREGSIWIGTGLAGLWRVQRVPISVVGDREGLTWAQAVAVWSRRDGTMQIGDEVGGVFTVRDGRAVPTRPLGSAPIWHIHEALDGTLWYLTDVQLTASLLVGRRADGSELRVRVPGPVTSLSDDPHRPGTLWVRQRQAISRLDLRAPGGPAVVWQRPLGRLGRGLLVARDGTVWTTGEDTAGHGTLWRIAQDSVHAYGAPHGIPAAQLRDLHEAADGALWIGTYGAGLVRWKDGVARQVTTREGLTDDAISSIVADGAGNLWLAGNRGVQRVALRDLDAVANGAADRVPSVLYDRADGLRNPEGSGRSAVRAPDGRLWFPTFGGAVALDPGLAVALEATPPLIHITGVSADGQPVATAPTVRLPLGRRRVAIAYRGVGLRRPDRLTYQHRLTPLDQEWVAAGSNAAATYPALPPGQYAFAVRAVNAGGVASAPATVDFLVPARPHESAWFTPLILLIAVAVAWQLYRWRVHQLIHREAALERLVDARTAALASETRRAEEALATVAGQADQLRTLDEAKSRFFANVSHEFRTPLSLVLGPLEDLRAGRDGRLSDGIQRKLDRVIANGQRLVRLVEQLLDVARLESGTLRLDLEVRDLVPLLRRVTESFASMAERRGIDFRLSCPVGGVPVRFDPDQMDKVLANLLGNALKFTESGGVVQLQVTQELGDAESSVVITISDTGIGIPADRLGRIFDRFYQVDDSPQRMHEGTGIGLAITKELLDLHGGRIAVSSRVGVGTTFTIRLPLARSDEPSVASSTPPRGTPARHEDRAVVVAPSRAAPAASDDAQATVLVVEDNAELRDYLRDHLSAEFLVLEAADGLRGVAMAREHLPDLVISDIMMPGMDGQALCATLKGSTETDFIPVMLLTARASRESRLSGLTEGADDYLTKPVDMAELLVRARNLVTSRRRQAARVPTIGTPQSRLTLQAGAALPAGSQVFLERLNSVLADHVGDENFQVDAMAAGLAVSRATLYRRIETTLGRSPMDVLWQYRLDQAALWLRETDATVSEIAYAVGFKSVPHFSRRFRARFDATPSAYRLAPTA